MPKFMHSNGERLYFVEDILKMREGKALVKWLGYPPSQATWEPVPNVVHTPAFAEWKAKTVWWRGGAIHTPRASTQCTA